MTNTNDKQPAKPTHRLYNVTGESDKAKWTEIGAAWSNADGKGFNIIMNAMPLGGRIVMRLITEKEGEA